RDRRSSSRRFVRCARSLRGLRSATPPEEAVSATPEPGAPSRYSEGRRHDAPAALGAAATGGAHLGRPVRRASLDPERAAGSVNLDARSPSFPGAHARLHGETHSLVHDRRTLYVGAPRVVMTEGRLLARRENLDAPDRLPVASERGVLLPER